MIALLPAGERAEYAIRSGSPTQRGFSRTHMVVYVPQDLPAERYEAQSLGGAGLGSGFHLVRDFNEDRDGYGPQIEGTVGPNGGCPSGECTTISSQRGELAPADEAVVIEAGADPLDVPSMFL